MERVADSLVLRWFCRVYFHRVPAATTLLRWAQTIQPETLHLLNDRVAQLAAQARVTRARKLRVDGTVVETTIHHPTDSGLLGDGVRVLTRLIKRAQPLVGAALAGTRDAFRDRSRTMRRTLRALHRLVRQKGEAVEAEQRQLYARLIQTTEQVLQQAQRVQHALVARAASRQVRARQQRAVASATAAGRGALRPRWSCRWSARRARGCWRAARCLPRRRSSVSLSRILASSSGARPGCPPSFGRHVVLDEVEGGIVTRYRICPLAGEHGELPTAVAHHQQVFGHPPDLVTGDRGFHLPPVQAAALQQAGVKHVAVPWQGPASAERRALEHSRAWRRRYRWRAGIEGRIHSLRRDYGLKRCADHGEVGMERRVGWGVLASNLWHIGQACTKRTGKVA